MELCKSCEMQCQRLVVCFWPENARDGVVTRRPRLAADGNCEHVSAPRSLTSSFHSPILSLLLVFFGKWWHKGRMYSSKKEGREGRTVYQNATRIHIRQKVRRPICRWTSGRRAGDSVLKIPKTNLKEKDSRAGNREPARSIMQQGVRSKGNPQPQITATSRRKEPVFLIFLHAAPAPSGGPGLRPPLGTKVVLGHPSDKIKN